MIINGFDDETNTIHFDYDDKKKGSGVEREYRAPIDNRNKKMEALKNKYKECCPGGTCDQVMAENFIKETLRMFWFHEMPETKITWQGIMLHEPASSSSPYRIKESLIKDKSSVHFIVDGKTGSIYSCLPLNRRAAHCGQCNQPYSENHCTEGHCKKFDKTKKPIVWKCKKIENCERGKDKSEADDKQCKFKVQDKEENCKYLMSWDRRPPSFNSSLLSIEICQSPDSEEGRKIYREKILPTTVELCAQLCFLFGFDPLARTKDTDVKLEKYCVPKEQEETQVIQNMEGNAEKQVIHCGSTEQEGSKVKWDIVKEETGVYSVPKTLITHREGHIFYRRASNHSDPDSYWMNVFEGLKKDVPKEEREVIEKKYYGPADFREAVDKKLKEIGEGLQGWKQIHPYLLLLFSTCGYSGGNH